MPTFEYDRPPDVAIASLYAYPQAYTAPDAMSSPLFLPGTDRHIRPAPSYERLDDTPIGPITILHSDSELPYDALDLAAVLAAHHPDTLQISGLDPKFLKAPGRQDILLRHNTADTFHARPRIGEMLVRLEQYEKGMVQLQSVGLHTLPRGLFIVEDDPHYQEPVVYTAVPRLQHIETLSPTSREQLNANVQACAALTTFHAVTPLGQAVPRQLTHPRQFSSKGVLLDYDPLASQSLGARLDEIDTLLNEWIARLPSRAFQEQFYEQLDPVIEQIYSQDPTLQP